MRESATVRKVLVTGAAGYQAGFVIERLRRHFELTLFDRVAPPAGRDTLPFVCGDITDADAEAVRRDSLFEWESAARQIGYAPAHNWPEITENEVGA